MKKADRGILERTGEKYDRIIFREDYVPKNVYIYQIRLRNNTINKCLSGIKFKCTLDFGCGTGFHLEALKEHSERLVGIDISVGALKNARKIVDGDYIACDAHKLPFKDEVVDAIICKSVLEHVIEPWKVVKEMYRVLKKGGYAFIRVPFLHPYHGSKIYKDYYRFSKDAIEYMFQDFEKIEFIHIKGYIGTLSSLFPKLLRKIVSKVSNRLDKCIGMYGVTTGYNIFVKNFFG